MAKQEKQQTLAVEPLKPIATTYYGARRKGRWEVCRVEVFEAADKPRVEVSPIFEHPDRRVAREQLRVLLAGREVLP